MYEVELKFPLADSREVVARLSAAGAEAGETVEQADAYFNHPQRDFAATDEAFRIRSSGTANCVTYKGPVLDQATKTRVEHEVGLVPGAPARETFADVLTALGFRPVRTVRKSRQVFRLRWQDRDLEIALDQVEGLGQFLEIETIADEAGREAAKSAILAFAARLELSTPERRSYLRLLLERDSE